MIKCQESQTLQSGLWRKLKSNLIVMRYFSTHINHGGQVIFTNSQSKGRIGDWKGENLFSEPWRGSRSARGAYKRRATHTRRVTHWASQACAILHACDAHTACGTLGKRATRRVSGPKIFAPSPRFMPNCLDLLASRFFTLT